MYHPHAKEIVYVNAKKLTLLEKNPRKIERNQFEKLCANIKADPDFFTNRPCLVNKVGDNLIVYAGNQRIRAAKKLGWQEVPCIIDENLDEKTQKNRIILDNLHHGEFDWDIVSAMYDVDELLNLGMLEKDLQIDKEIIESSEQEDGEILEPGKEEEAFTRPGDLYELNHHRLICGDSTQPDIVLKLLSDQTPVLMVTDPPYGVEYEPKWRTEVKGKKVAVRAGGKVKNDDIVDWSVSYALFPGSVAYVWHAAWFSDKVKKNLEDCEFEIKSQIIWAKQHFALSRGDYHWQHEPCWYAVKKGCNHNWQGDRKQSTLWEITNHNAFGGEKQDEDRTAHGTQKPIECMEKPIRNNTEQHDIVYDPFLGSGTTLIAAEKLKRFCYGVELSPSYCDIIVNRWVNHMKKNGKPYTLIRNGVTISWPPNKENADGDQQGTEERDDANDLES